MKLLRLIFLLFPVSKRRTWSKIRKSPPSAVRSLFMRGQGRGKDRIGDTLYNFRAVAVFVVRNYILFVALAAVVFFGGLWVELLGALRFLLAGATETSLSEIQKNPEEARGIAYLIAASAAALVAVASAPLALLKAWVNERQARTDEDRHITERIMRAVEQLGTEKVVKREIGSYTSNGEPERQGATVWEVTEPNIEVRLGAIYALERIAQESEKDHISVLETLCAYVRENSYWRFPRDLNLSSWIPPGENAKEVADLTRMDAWTARFGENSLDGGNIDEWSTDLPIPREDIQAILKVLGRRSSRRLDYENRQSFQILMGGTNLQRAQMSDLQLGAAVFGGARMEGVRLRRAYLEGAGFAGTNLTGADLGGANLNWSYMVDAKMQKANLKDAKLRYADLRGACLECADLSGADLRGATLTGARLEGADLSYARLDGALLDEACLDRANLRRTRLDGATLRDARFDHASFVLASMRRVWFPRRVSLGVNVRSADISDSVSLSQEQVNAFFGDKGTILPEGIKATTLLDRPSIGDPVFDMSNYDNSDYSNWVKQGAPSGTPKRVRRKKKKGTGEV